MRLLKHLALWWRLGMVFFVLAVLAAGKYYFASESAPAWQITRSSNNHQIEGYSSEPSIAQGSSIAIHVSCTAKTFHAEVYRMGFYEGAGAKKVIDTPDLRCRQGRIPKPDARTGLVQPDWPVSFTLNISGKWQAGVYLIKLCSSAGFQRYVPFTVKVARSQNKYLFIHAVNTDNAYNRWGGNSLYRGHTPSLNIDRAAMVAFNRPFGSGDGAGQFLRWEYPMIKFLEQYGYGIDYATDVDIDQHPEILQNYKTIIISGHDEYWSRSMRQGFLSAQGHGVNLAIFAANTAYRPVRFESDNGLPDQIMIDYKDKNLDPQTEVDGDNIPTPLDWHSAPLKQSESEITGLTWTDETADDGVASAGLAVADDKSWALDGTGLRKGDHIPGLVGYEYDRYEPNQPHPSKVEIIFHSPLINGRGQTSAADVGYFVCSNGAQVFNAGTIQWSWGLDKTNARYDSRVVQITRNVLNRLGSNQEIFGLDYSL